MATPKTSFDNTEDHFDEYEHYNFDDEKSFLSGHSGKQRTKKEASMNTNRHNPGGHERKITTNVTLNVELMQSHLERNLHPTMEYDITNGFREVTPTSSSGEKVELARTKWALPSSVRSEIDQRRPPPSEVYTPKYIREIHDSDWSRKYGVHRNPTRHDLYVKNTLKLFDYDIYGSLRQYTRQPAGIRGMYKQLAKYDGPSIPLNKLPRRAKRCMELAKAQAREAFKLENKPYRYQMEDMAEHLEPSSSAGYSFPGMKKSECIPEILQKAEELHNSWKKDIPGGKFTGRSLDMPPCIAAQRGGMSILGLWKTRLVWVYPAELIALEGRYAFPLYEEYRKRPTKPMLYGNDADSMVNLWMQGKKATEYLVGLDISSFDCTVCPDLIDFAFDVAFENINPCDPIILENPKIPEKDKLRHIRYEQKKHVIMKQALREYFKHTPILMPDGRLFVTNRGVPSGTAFTQLIDSIINYVYVSFAANLQDAKIQHLTVLGDDSGFFTNKFDIEQCATDFGKYLGVELHPDKCDKTTRPADFKLLGFTYPGGKRHRPTTEWFAMALCPEHYVSDIGTSWSRLYGLFLAGAKYDEKFCRFMNFYQTCWPIPDEFELSRDVRVLLTKVLHIPIPSWREMRSKHIFNEAYEH